MSDSAKEVIRFLIVFPGFPLFVAFIAIWADSDSKLLRKIRSVVGIRTVSSVMREIGDKTLEDGMAQMALETTGKETEEYRRSVKEDRGI